MDNTGVFFSNLSKIIKVPKTWHNFQKVVVELFGSVGYVNAFKRYYSAKDKHISIRNTCPGGCWMNGLSTVDDSSAKNKTEERVAVCQCVPTTTESILLHFGAHDIWKACDIKVKKILVARARGCFNWESTDSELGTERGLPGSWAVFV